MIAVAHHLTTSSLFEALATVDGQALLHPLTECSHVFYLHV